MNLFAGIDVSTQSCKLVIIDPNLAQVCHIDTVVYDNDLPAYKTLNGVRRDAKKGVSESDPEMWIEAIKILFKRLKDSGIDQEKIRSMSVSGQQHGLVALDKDGSLASPYAKLWNDFSTQEECDILTQAVGGVGKMIAEVGNSQRTGYTASKILHLKRNDPESFEQTTTLFLVHNYINWFLSGGVRVMEPGDTSGMALWDPVTKNWSEPLLRSIDPTLKMKLPAVHPSDQSIGTISADLAREFGLNPRCTIDAGSGDNMYGAIGTGNIELGIVTISLGTSGTVYSFMTKPYIDPTGEVAAFCDSTGNYLPLLCVSNVANGYNKLLDLFGLSHEAFNKIIMDSPLSAGKVVVPWFEGERTPDIPNAVPFYFGFGLDEFNKESLCRPVLEGIVHNLYHGFQRLPVEPKEIRLTGGLSQSPIWVQMIADIFNSEVVPVEGEGAALGAAIHAAWVWSKEYSQGIALKDLTTPFVKLREDLRTTPKANHKAYYDGQKQLYTTLIKKLCSTEHGDLFNSESVTSSEVKQK